MVISLASVGSPIVLIIGLTNNDIFLVYGCAQPFAESYCAAAETEHAYTETVIGERVDGEER
jgi:hypothetical protein